MRSSPTASPSAVPAAHSRALSLWIPLGMGNTRSLGGKGRCASERAFRAINWLLASRAESQRQLEATGAGGGCGEQEPPTRDLTPGRDPGGAARDVALQLLHSRGTAVKLSHRAIHRGSGSDRSHRQPALPWPLAAAPCPPAPACSPSLSGDWDTALATAAGQAAPGPVTSSPTRSFSPKLMHHHPPASACQTSTEQAKRGAGQPLLVDPC